MAKKMDRRYTLTIKLNRANDADLINWWEALPKGDWTGENPSRQRRIKNALRHAASLPIPPAPGSISAGVIEQIYQDMESIAARISEAQPPAAPEQINRLETYIHEQLTEVAKHINGLYQQLNGLTGLPVIDQTPVESAQRVSDAKLAERRENRKKNQW